MELHKRMGTYRRGMNLDDPMDDADDGTNKQAAAKKKQRKIVEFCEYCGLSNHLTRRSKKCIAPPQSGKKYRKTDGTLLTEPPRALAPTRAADREDDDEEDPIFGAADLSVPDVDDCDDFDQQPLIHMPGEEGFDIELFLGDDTVDDAGDGEDGVACVGGAI
jgi:hypothetical protein